jgi:hypothetical protein
MHPDDVGGLQVCIVRQVTHVNVNRRQAVGDVKETKLCQRMMKHQCKRGADMPSIQPLYAC